MLARIEGDFFKGVDLAGVSLLEGNERRDFRLAQVERLLTEEHESSPLAMFLSDMFWTADEGRILMDELNPLMTLAGQQTLTDEERSRLRLILEIAGLCHDLSLHFTFDLKEAFGIKKNDFWVSNKQLVEWLTTTEYEHVAMHTAYIMKKHAIGVYTYGHYLPAQDELAELFSSEYGELIREPDSIKEISTRAYVQIIIEALLRIEKHLQRGLKRKLKLDVIILHDEIYGVVPRQFDKGVLQAAQALYDYMDKELYGRLTQIVRSYNVFSWNELPDAGKRASNEVLNRFAEKVREVRSEYLAEGWVTDDSLSFSYLMDHAQRCGYGLWREEDDAL